MSRKISSLFLFCLDFGSYAFLSYPGMTNNSPNSCEVKLNLHKTLRNMGLGTSLVIKVSGNFIIS